MEKGFFKFFSPENSSKQLKIPAAFTDYKNGKIPRKVSLRDRFGNMWPIGVVKTESDFYFHYGWAKFIEENTVEFGDILIFDYDGNGVFDFKLLGKNGCEKKGAGALKLAVKKDEEEMNVEHQKSVEPKRKNFASFSSSSSSSSSDSDEDYMVEEEDEDEEEYDYEEDEEIEVENEKIIIMCKKKEPRSKGRRVEEEDDEEAEEEGEEEEEIEKVPHSKSRHVEEEEDDEEETEEEEENERAGIFKKKAPCSKVGCKRATTRKVRDLHDPYGADIFRSGRATQPKNPYFVEKIRVKRRDQLYVPIDVVRDFKLELPPTMIIRDSNGREFETKIKNWKDGRIWLLGGWRSLCRWNLVEKDDRIICEFVRGKGKKGLYLQVQVLHEGASSLPSKRSKK